MGTILSRKRSNGTAAFMATIRISRDGKTAHRETQTFDRRAAAAAWIAKREEELNRPGGMDRARIGTVTLADAIERYIATSLKEIGRTKAQVLRTIKGESIAALPCERVNSQELVAFAEDLSSRMQPQTVANYLSHLGAVFAIAGPAWGYSLDAQALRDAHAVARRLGLTRKTTERDRRPTLAEIDRIMEHFASRTLRTRTSPPMARIIPFAIFSTRRQEEITRIAWDDLDVDGSRIMVRDMKNPGEKIGNNVHCDLPAEALAIIQATPHIDARIFPYKTDAISAAFTRACKVLAIEDLRFHDLRHDGVSRLFEQGLSIPRVAAVSGHRSWTSLKRYTHMRQVGDKYARWKWLEK